MLKRDYRIMLLIMAEHDCMVRKGEGKESRWHKYLYEKEKKIRKTESE